MNNITIIASENNKNKVHIRLRLHINSEKTELTIFTVPSADWDDQKKLVKKSNPQHKDLNLLLNQKKGLINNIFVKYRLMNTSISKEQFLKEYKNPSLSYDFLEFLRLEIENHARNITHGTLKHHRSLYTIMVQFKDQISFSEVNHDFLTNFLNYLKHNRKNNINSIHSTFKILKFYIKVALDRALILSNPYKNIKLRKSKKMSVFLEIEELNRLINLYKSNRLNDTRLAVLRQYLFCCFTGLRISDCMQITFDNLISKKYLVFTPQKTKHIDAKTLRLKLNEPALKLIKDEGRVDGKIFQMKSPQVTNRWLKEVFIMAGIKREKISFHSSRHTFATTYLLKSKDGLAFPKLSKLLGHSTVQQTLDTYIGIATLLLDEAMDVFNEFKL